MEIITSTAKWLSVYAFMQTICDIATIYLETIKDK